VAAATTMAMVVAAKTATHLLVTTPQTTEWAEYA
jgi:hypothetical protein